MATTQQLFTADDLLNLREKGARHELVRGELRTMPPAGFEHGSIGTSLLAMLWNHVNRHRLGVMVGPDTGFVIERDPDTVRSPDIAFVSIARLEQTGIPRKYYPGAPDLAVEVLSPSDTAEEVEEKVADWLAAGTKLVWVINPKRRTVSIHRPGGKMELLAAGQRLAGEDVVPGFECEVGALFA